MSICRGESVVAGSLEWCLRNNYTFVALKLAWGEARGRECIRSDTRPTEQRSPRPISAQPGGRHVFWAEALLLAPHRSTSGYALVPVRKHLAPSVVSRNWLVFRRKEFSFPARRERRAYPSAVCEERATKREAKSTAARRVAPKTAWGFVAPGRFGRNETPANCETPH